MAAETAPMDTTYTDIREGERTDITVEFVSRRAVDCGDRRVCRLLVVDRTGRQFSVLTTPDSGSFPGLKVGERYRFSRLLGAAPVGTVGETTAECSVCEGSLRPGRTIDAVNPAVGRAASQLELQDPFGIVDARASMWQVRDGVAGVAPADARDPTDSTVTLPDYICVSCGRHVGPADASCNSADGGRDDTIIQNSDDANSTLGTAGTGGLSPAPAGGATANLDGDDIGPDGVTNTTFRATITDGNTPRPETISTWNPFADYQFEVGIRNGSEGRFVPRYGTAVSEHPITGETERYLLVEMGATRPADTFERPRLDLVAVLDVSGTAGTADVSDDGDGGGQTDSDDVSPKWVVATRVLRALAEQLEDGDRLGVVVCNARAKVTQPLRDGDNVPAIRRHLRDTEAAGGATLADGLEAAVDLLATDPRRRQRERRAVCVTDTMPEGENADELAELVADAATGGVHTTVLGLGPGVNAELPRRLSDIRGANHDFVSSAGAFEYRLNAAFDAMVTPLGYDLAVEIEADGYEIGAVHGPLSADAATDRLAHVGTLFPSVGGGGRARGGTVLVELEQTGKEGRRADLDVHVAWLERNGGGHTESVILEMPDDTGTYTHRGVRKAVALARYARELRAWTRDRHDSNGGSDDRPSPERRRGREPLPLAVPGAYAERFDRLRTYLRTEMEAVADETMRRELKLLERLCRQAPKLTTG